MDDVRVDSAAVQALTREVLEAADRIDDMPLPTIDSARLPGSAAARAAGRPALAERLADVAGHLRTWAVAAQASATALDSAEYRHARTLGESR